MFTLPRTPDPLAPAHVVVGPADRAGSRTSMFKRVSGFTQREDDVRSREDLVH
jgi:hypothetical protein